MMATIFAVLVLGLGFFEARGASGEPAPDDGAPGGMVAFTSGGICPPGWEEVYDVEGRMVVGAIYPEDVGLDVGTPLADREDRAHGHAFSGELVLSGKGILAANGGNQNGAAAGTYEISGTTKMETSGLPFYQIAGCVKP